MPIFDAACVFLGAALVLAALFAIYDEGAL